MKPTFSRPANSGAATAMLTALYLAAAAAIAPAIVVAAPVPAASTTADFAQSDQIVTPAATDARRLASYFSPPYHSGPLPAEVDEMLARDVPADLRAGCAVTVDSWNPSLRDRLGENSAARTRSREDAALRGRSGENLAAQSRARVTVRILGVANGSAWLAYRCDSGNSEDAHRPQADGEYTERLALFNSARRTIQFVGLKAREDTATTLYHVGLAETVKLRGAENSATFVVFAFGSSAHNGTRSTEDRQAEDRFVVIANSTSAAKLVLALVTARQRPDAGNGNATDSNASSSSDEYRAQLRLDHDLAGHLTAVDVYYREAPPDARSHFGVNRYVWNPATLRFAVGKPLPAPQLRRQQPTRLPLLGRCIRDSGDGALPGGIPTATRRAHLQAAFAARNE